MWHFLIIWRISEDKRELKYYITITWLDFDHKYSPSILIFKNNYFSKLK